MKAFWDKNGALSPWAAYLLVGVGALGFGLAAASGVFKYELDRSLAIPEGAGAASADFWSLALMMAAWGTGLFVVLLAGTLHVLLRSRNTEPLQNLTQSISHLAKGDLKSSVWGIERQDALGDLARAVDRARLQFSQMPDIALMSDQGPVRFRFEGSARSLFEMVMGNIATSFEQARTETSTYNETARKQQELMGTLSHHLSSSLVQIQNHGTSTDKSLQAITRNLTEAARRIVEGQDKTTGKLAKLVPFLEERAKNMAEVTQLTGTQVAQSLQVIVQAEEQVRANAAQSSQTVKLLSESANQMGEKLFAAVNLAQASGKVLGETAEAMKNGFTESVESVTRNADNLRQLFERAEARVGRAEKTEEDMAALASRTEASATKMEEAVKAISVRHEQLGEQVAKATQQMEGLVAGFSGAQREMTQAVQTVTQNGGELGGLLNELKTHSTSSAKALLQMEEQALATEGKIESLASQSGLLAQQAQTATTALMQTIASLRAEHDLFTATRARFAETVDSVNAKMDQQIHGAFGKTEQLATQNFGKLSELTGQVDEVLQRLAIMGQLTGTLGAVAGQLGQVVPALAQGAGGSSTVEPLVRDMRKQWQDGLVHIEAMHDQLAQLVVQQKDQLEMRLSVLDKKIKSGDGAEPPVNTRQAELMNEIVAALAKINDHVMQLDEAVEGLKAE